MLHNLKGITFYQMLKRRDVKENGKQTKDFYYVAVKIPLTFTFEEKRNRKGVRRAHGIK